MSAKVLKRTTKKAPNRATAITPPGRSKPLGLLRPRTADAVQAEDLFGEDRAAAETAPKSRPNSVTIGISELRSASGANLALAQPLRPRGPHLVLVHRVEHAGAQDAAVEADEEEGEGHPGQDEVVAPFDTVLPVPDVAAGGEEFSLEGQVEEEDRASQKTGIETPVRAKTVSEPVVRRPACTAER